MRALHLFAGIEVARNDEKPLRVSRRRGPAASKNVITFPSPRLRGTLFFILEARPARRSACILSIYARAYLGVKRVTATQILPAGFLLDRKAHTSDIASDPPDPIPATCNLRPSYRPVIEKGDTRLAMTYYDVIRDRNDPQIAAVGISGTRRSFVRLMY